MYRIGLTLGHWLLVFFRPPGKPKYKEIFKKDLVNQMFFGAAGVLLNSIGAVVLMQVYAGHNFQLALLQSGVMFGLLASFLFAHFSAKKRLLPSYIFPRFLGFLVLFLVGFCREAWEFTILATLAAMLMNVSLPLHGVLYQNAFEQQDRGRLVSYISRWQLAASVGLAYVAGLVIEKTTGDFRIFYFVVAVGGMVSTVWLLWSSFPIRVDSARDKIFSSFHLIFQDKNFSRFLFFQFILGMANISGIAVIFIYLNNKNFFAVSPAQAALLTGVIPPAFMFLSLGFWGKVFDRIDIVRYRVVTSFCIGLGFLVYGSSSVFWGAILASVLWGMGRGGGQLAWKIGVLAFCDEKRASSYLGIHTFLTGVRGVIAPFLGAFAIEQGVAPKTYFLWVSAAVFFSALGTWLWVKPVKSS